MLYRNRSLDLVLESIRDSASPITDGSVSDMSAAIAGALKDMRAAYKGGDAALDMLIMKRGTSPDDAQAMRRHFMDKPIAGVVVDTHARFLYGTPPQRAYWVGPERPDAVRAARRILAGESVESDKRTEALSQWFRDVHDANNHAALFMRGARLMMRDGMAALKVWLVYEDEDYTDEAKTQVRTEAVPVVRMDFMGTLPGSQSKANGSGYEDAIPIFDPEDADYVIAVLELRRNRKGDVVKRTLWGNEEYTDIGDDWEPIGAPEPHPYGAPPFVFLGDGSTLLHRVIGYQRAAVNVQSALSAGIRTMAGQQVAVQKGRDNNPREDDGSGDGKGRVRMGRDNILYLDEGNTDFFFASPSFDAAPIGSELEKLVQEGMTMADLAPAIVLGGLAAIQPETLKQMLIPTIARYTENVTHATAFEDDKTLILARIAHAYAGEFGLPSGWDIYEGQRGDNQLDWDITFADSPLPVDRASEETRDSLAITHGTLTLEEFVGKYRLPSGSAQEIADYVKALREADKARFQDTMPTFGEGKRTMLDDPDAEEPTPSATEPTAAPTTASANAQDIGAVTDAVDFQALSLLLERLKRINDLALANVVRDKIAGALDASVAPLTEEQFLGPEPVVAPTQPEPNA
ncbi:MAG: hypothetical protein WC683_09830 [bacterium]